jgi:Flp pilus assembly protein protease CpaA
MLVTVLLLGLVSVAAATDLAWHKIYNWTTYPGILAALGLSAAGLGLKPWRESVAGFLVCGLVMLACYVFFNIRGGDVKLIAMLGAFLGWEDGIIVMLWTFILGACVALSLLVWRVGPGRLAKHVLWRLLWIVRIRGWVPLGEEERELLQPRMSLAPCALVATVIVLFRLIPA